MFGHCAAYHCRRDVLAVSRAFGDRLLKKYVVAEPDILDTALTGNDTLLIMATDGLWDVVSNQDAISMVRVIILLLLPPPPLPSSPPVTSLLSYAHCSHYSFNIPVHLFTLPL